MLGRKSIKFLSLFLIFLFFIALYSFNRFSYSEEMPFYSIESDKSEFLKIGIIGDSWVARNKIDSILKIRLLEDSIKCKIISSGHPGARSKLIYQNLFKDQYLDYSSKYVITSKPDYCIVIAGVNDAASQIGAKNYSHHMILIIKTLLHNNIKPIIISLPEFGIKKATDNLNILSKIRNLTSAYFNNDGEIDNINTYRKVFDSELKRKGLIDDIIIIDFDNVCTDYNNCLALYANYSHMSIKGNEKLCSIISDELVKVINSQ